MIKSALGEILVKQGKVAPDRVQTALELQNTVGERLGTNLLEIGAVSEEGLLSTLGELRGAPTVSWTDLQKIPRQVLRQIPKKMAERYKVVPFGQNGKTLLLAGMDPGDLLVEDEITFLTGCMVKTHLALEVRVRQALHRYYGSKISSRMTVLIKRLAGQQAGGVAQAPQPPRSTPPPTPTFRSPLAGRPDKPAAAKPAAAEPEEQFFVELSDEDAELFGLSTAAPETTPADPALLDPALVLPPPAAATPIAVPPVAEAPSEAEFDDEPVDDADLTPEDRLVDAAQALQEAEMRDEIADAIFGFCAPYFQRRLLFVNRKGKILGWRGEGAGVLRDLVRTIEIEGTEPSVFLSLNQGAQLWTGPLPATPPNQRIIEGIGSVAPKECVVLPIVLRSKVVAFLYGDNMADGNGGVPIHQMRRLAAKAGVAFEVYILKNKIRLM